LVALAGILLLGTSPRPRQWHPYAIGALVAWGFAARYVDVLWLGAAGAVATLRSRSRPGDLRPLVAAGATAALLAVPVFAAQWDEFGSPLTTPYSLHAGTGEKTHVTDDQLGAYDLGKVPSSAFGMFISPFLLGKRASGSPLLADMFWTLAAVAGAVIALLDRRNRLFVAVLLAGWLASTVFYLSFRATGAAGIQFGTLHYFKMWWPVAAILAAGMFARLESLGRATQ
jgi:hypothetical protein